MKVIESNVRIQLTQEERNKFHDVADVLSDLYDLMCDYEQKYVNLDFGNKYSSSQIHDLLDLAAMLTTSEVLRLEKE